jgi:hypothetical protein
MRGISKNYSPVPRWKSDLHHDYLCVRTRGDHTEAGGEARGHEKVAPKGRSYMIP